VWCPWHVGESDDPVVVRAYDTPSEETVCAKPSTPMAPVVAFGVRSFKSGFRTVVPAHVLALLSSGAARAKWQEWLPDRSAMVRGTLIGLNAGNNSKQTMT
ncbi:unnamed protein product, partial [Scytosiphon promiscuus]